MNETWKIIQQVNMLLAAGGGKPLELAEDPAWLKAGLNVQRSLRVDFGQLF